MIDRRNYENIEEVGLSLMRLKSLLDLLGFLTGADQKILRTDMIAATFDALAELVSLIQSDVQALIVAAFPDT